MKAVLPAIARPLVEPHVRPSGSLAQPVMVWYGFGRSFVGAMVALDCASARTTSVAKETAITSLQVTE